MTMKCEDWITCALAYIYEGGALELPNGIAKATERYCCSVGTD
jgi:hypothetical protein